MKTRAPFLVGLGLVMTTLALPASPALAAPAGPAAQQGATVLPGQPPSAITCEPQRDGWVIKSGPTYWECKPDINRSEVWQWQALP